MNPKLEKERKQRVAVRDARKTASGQNPEQVQFIRLALSMAGLVCDDITADLIGTVLAKQTEMGEDFDLKTACQIEAKIKAKYEIKP